MALIAFVENVSSCYTELNTNLIKICRLFQTFLSACIFNEIENKKICSSMLYINSNADYLYHNFPAFKDDLTPSITKFVYIIFKNFSSYFKQNTSPLQT